VFRARLVAGALVACLSIACSSSDGPHKSALEESRSVWRGLVAMNGETYSYAVETSSFSGSATRTLLQFEPGAELERAVATYRGFEVATPTPEGARGPLVLQWEERGAEIGSHPDGAPADTVDVLYDRCARDVLTKDPKLNDISLEFDDAGILRLCSYFPRGCQDDCSVGVLISDLQFGKTY